MATLNRTFSVKNGIDVANTVIVDSNRNISNVINVAASYVSANSAVVNGNVNVAGTLFTGNVIPHGNNTHNLGTPTARFKDLYLSGSTIDLDGTTISVSNGEIVSNTFNASISFVSGGLNVLNQANTARTTANDAYAQANTARTTANDAYGQANSARNQANTAYGQANAAYLQANNAYAEANLKLNLAGGTITGNLNVNNYLSSNGFISTSTNLAPPNLANTYGERIRLYDFNQAGHPNYAIGVEGSHIWMGVDDIGPGLGFKWYGNTTLVGLLRTNSTFEVSNTVAAKTIRANGTGVAIDASQGNILTNQVTGTQFNFLNGAYTVSLNGAGSTSNYALSLPANTGLAGQALVTDGTGNLYWTSSASSTQANDAYTAANTALETANAAYGQANAARSTANSAANTVRVSANGGSTLSGKQLNFINTASVQVVVGDAADGNANISFVTTGAAVADAYAQANAAYGQANAAYGQANAAYGKANAAYNTANAKIEVLNAAGAIDISSGVTNNVVSYTINVNRANVTTVGVTQLVDSISSSDTANAATANAVKWTYDFANTMLPKAGGTVSGDLTVQGNLFLTGNATYINVATVRVNDSIIQLSTNSTSDAVDIGFVGHYSDDGGTTNLHSGFIRHASDNVFYVFDGYGIEPTNNVIDLASANLAWFRANVNAATLLINGNAAATQANLTLAHDAANNASNVANGAYAQANGAYAQANGAYASANGAYAQANGAYAQANGAYAQANGAYAQANAANDNANTRVLKSGDTMTGGLTITTNGTGLSVGNAAVSFKLTVGSLNVTTNTVTTLSSGQVVLDKFQATDLASAKYFVQVNSGSDYHTTEVVLVQDATNVWLTEYGSIQTGPSLGNFSADISSGDVRLLFTAVNSVNTIRSVRYGIAT